VSDVLYHRLFSLEVTVLFRR